MTIKVSLCVCVCVGAEECCCGVQYMFVRGTMLRSWFGITTVTMVSTSNLGRIVQSLHNVYSQLLCIGHCNHTCDYGIGTVESHVNSNEV